MPSLVTIIICLSISLYTSTISHLLYFLSFIPFFYFISFNFVGATDDVCGAWKVSEIPGGISWTKKKQISEILLRIKSWSVDHIVSGRLWYEYDGLIVYRSTYLIIYSCILNFSFLLSPSLLSSLLSPSLLYPLLYSSLLLFSSLLSFLISLLLFSSFLLFSPSSLLLLGISFIISLVCMGIKTYLT